MASELILIVEDNPTNLKLVRDTLQAKGYRTIDAGTGEEGVQLAREQQPASWLARPTSPRRCGLQMPGRSLPADARTVGVNAPAVSFVHSILRRAVKLRKVEFPFFDERIVPSDSRGSLAERGGSRGTGCA